MNNNDFTDWLKNETANLTISNEYFHHHAYEIISTHSTYQKQIIELLNKKISISPRIKNTKKFQGPAIKADDLNREIRKLLSKKSDSNLKFEVYEDRGVFYFSSQKGAIGGFDFAIINHERNLYALRNICFGEVQYYNGQDRWKNFLEKNPELEKIANYINEPAGEDAEYKKRENDPPLLVGEIQFGNWGLVYRDLFKVLKANVQNSVDCLIYIVPDGNLVKLLSDNIVNYETTKDILIQFSKVITVPVWLIGIDVKL